MKNVFIISCFQICQFALTAQEFNVLNYGATGDGITLNTQFIQRAIDAAHDHGGGRVVLPEGTFLSGSIILKSQVELYLAEGAVLLGSTDPAQYLKLNRWKALVMADGEQHIVIAGKGEIDGQGRQLALHIDSLFYAGQIDSIDYNFIEKRPKYYLRPQLIEFVNCNHVTVKNITLKNAACWVQTYDQCTQLKLDSLRVESDAYWNNDGIDIQDCINVRVTNCFINSADDGICLKSQSAAHLCDSIYIADCTVRSSASAIKFGTVSHGGFKNVTIERIKIYDTFRSAVAMECVDGGILENVLVQHIDAVNTGNAIFIRLGDRSKTRPPGAVRNLVLRDIKVQVAFEPPDYAYEIRGPELPFFHNTFPCSITGIPGHPVQSIILKDIEITFPGRGNNGLANLPLSRLDQVPEKEEAYPEFSMFGELPAWGFYVRHVEGLILKNIQLKINAPDYRPAFVFDDVRQLEMKNVDIQGDNKPHRIVLRHTEEVMLNDEQGVLKM